MLLRRLSKHVQEQNWTAVGLDFMVVVLGIFVGLQATAWNENRTTQKAETEILKRLHAETLSVIEAQDSSLQRFAANMSHLYAVREMMFGFTELRPITPTECAEVSIAYIFQPLPVSIPILGELMATGRIEILRDESLRSAGTQLQRTGERFGRMSDKMQSRMADLPREFPELMSIGLETANDPEDIDGYVPTYSCHLDLMVNDPAFLNAFMTNVSISNGIYDNALLTHAEYKVFYELLDTKLRSASE